MTRQQYSINRQCFSKLVVTVALLGMFFSGCASVPTENRRYDVVYSPTQLKEDLAFIDEKLRTIHPNLFSRQSEASYSAAYDATYKTLIGPSNRRQYFTNIAPLLASFQDTHIQLQLPVEEFTEFSNEQGLFPLKVLITEGKFIVIADEQDLPTIPVGAEIKAINGVSTGELLPLLGQLVPSETETGQIRLIQVHLAKLLWSVFPEQNQYQVTYAWRAREFVEQLVPELSYEQVPELPIEPISSSYGTRTIDAKTSLLWLNDFNESYGTFDEFLESYFLQLRDKKKTNLILDLRYNQGGLTDNLKLLLSYLSPRPINWAERARLKISEEFKKQHRDLVGVTKSDKYTAYLGWLPMEYLNLWQWELLFSSEGDVLETNIDPLIENQDTYFQGNIVVLSNGYCFSACAALLSNLQSHDLATILGESPGSYIGTQYGYPIQVRLPNTGLLLSLPAMEIILHEDVGSTKNLEPNYTVARTQDDVIKNRDIVLTKALEFIRQKQ